MKPFYKLNIPFNKDQFLAPSFKLPGVESTTYNKYINITQPDHRGVAFNSIKSNNWNFDLYKYKIPLTDFLSDRMINFLDSISFDVTAIWILFFNKQNPPGVIHCDWGPNRPEMRQNNYSINWSYAADHNHSMVWYEPIDTRLTEDGWPVAANTHQSNVVVPIFEKDAVKEIARHTIDGPTLVQTNIPHNGENNGSNYRWIVSIKSSSTTFANWNDTVNYFKDIIQE